MDIILFKKVFKITKVKRFNEAPKIEGDVTAEKEPHQIKYIRNLFILGKGNNMIKSQITDDIRSLI